MKGKGSRTLVFVLVAAIFLAAIFIFAQNGKSDKGYYQLIGLFPNSAGLNQGQEINCLGQKIGYIKKTELQVPRRRVVVTMLIENKTKVPVGSTLEVNINSLLGSKSLAIIPPVYANADVFCQSNDTLQGRAPTTLAEIQNKLGSLIDTATSKVHQLDISNLNQTVDAVQRAATHVDTIAGDLRPQLDSTIYKANQLIITYRQAGEKIETTAAAIDSLAQKGSRGADSLPALIQETRHTVHKLEAAGDFFQHLKRFFGFHD